MNGYRGRTTGKKIKKTEVKEFNLFQKNNRAGISQSV
jgi:hypothetical protein